MTCKLRAITIQAIDGLIPLSGEELSAERLKVCTECDHFAGMTRQCRLCWCFMDLKTKILDAQCPAEKW